MSQRIQGVLLDIDGTLVDSNKAHAMAWVEAFEEFGIQLEERAVREKIGMGGDHLVPELAKISRDSKQKKQIDERRGEIFREKYLPNIKPFPAAQQLLEYFASLGLRLVVASSAQKEDLEKILRQTGLENLVRAVTSSEDAVNSKPDTDIIEAAITKSGLPHAAVFMLGDTPYDIEAAQRANIPIIALTCGGWKRDDLEYAQSIFADAHALLEHLKKQEQPLVELHALLYNNKVKSPFGHSKGKTAIEIPTAF